MNPQEEAKGLFVISLSIILETELFNTNVHVLRQIFED